MTEQSSSRSEADPSVGETDDRPYTDEELRAFRGQYLVRRDRQKRTGMLFAATTGVIVTSAVLLELPADYWVPLVGAMALAALVFSLVNWKCPACGARLPTRHSQGSCPECDMTLE